MELKKQRMRLIFDITMIVVITIFAVGFYYFNKDSILTIAVDKNYNILIRALIVGSLHFAVAGLGMCIVIIIRKEKFEDYGLNGKSLLKTLSHSFVLLVAFLAVTVLRGTWRLVYPFRQIWITEQLLEAPIAIMLICLLFFVVFCGFFEGLNYAYLSRKINRLWPAKNIFLSPGPILVGLLGFAVHSLLGINGWEHSVQTFFLIYGMLLIYENTKNAWGCVVIFGLLWNAL